MLREKVLPIPEKGRTILRLGLTSPETVCPRLKKVEPLPYKVEPTPEKVLPTPAFEPPTPEKGEPLLEKGVNFRVSGKMK